PHAEHGGFGAVEANETTTADGPPRSTRREVLLGLAGGLLGGALPGFATAEERRPRTALADVPGLDQRVTYCETKIPLGEFVAKVAADTGIPLTAARDVADEPVAVVVTDFPARELLDGLAELLGYRWRRTPLTGSRLAGSKLQVGESKNNLQPANLQPATPFEIWQDLASKQQEEALREELRAQVEQHFQEQLAICRDLAGKSDEEMRRLWLEMEPRFERLVALPRDQQWTQSETPEGLRDGYVRMLWSPISRSLARLAGRLAP